MEEKKEESFGEWLGKHADSIVDEVLKNPDTNNNDGEYQLYNELGGLVNTFTNRKIAIHVAKKKHLTIRHVRQGVTQPEEEKT